MKRALMTADTVGGVWNYSVALIRSQPDLHFALCTMGAALSSAQERDIARLENVTVFPSRYRLEWQDNSWSDVDAAGEWLLKIAAQFQPDLVHLNGYSHAALPWNAPVLVVAHSCVLSWWRAVKQENAPPRLDEYRERVTAGLNAADLVIAPSRSMLDSLRENYDAQFTGRVIYNGADPSRFSLREKQPVILAAGRIWDEAKNLFALDAAVPSISWPIEIAGDLCAPAGGECFQLSHARALGKLNAHQLAAKMSTAAIFATAARYEPFGLSILEAALSGCALVLGDIPSLRELWDEAALFVNPLDSDQLAHTLNRLIDEPETRDQFSRRARERASTFSLKRMSDGYRDAYAHLVSEAAEFAA